MKTYRRPTLLIVLGITSLLLTASFRTYNACKFANTNSLYIKNQARLALEANDFKMVKYHAYKALTGIEKAKTNFKDCGCDAAIKSIDRTKLNLKNATKAPSIYDAKAFVDIALKNTTIGISALKNYNPNSIYGSESLTMNTNQSDVLTEEIIELKGNTLSEKIENGVSKFKKSLDEMIKVNDCKIAFEYVQSTYESSSDKSKDTTVSPGKRYFHRRISEVTLVAMKDLENCK